MKTQINKKSKQGGFTLVEIAIVLVIIGLILGGVLQGQSMIENARFRNFVQEIDGYRAAYYSFQDRYRALPGDILNTAPLNAAATAGNGNGQIAGSYCSANNEESCLVWSHLRYGGFITGDPTLTNTTAIPNHAYGGPVSSISLGNWGNGIREHKIMLQGVPGDVAQRYDDANDDGDATSGRISRIGGGTAQTYNQARTLNVAVSL